MVSKSIFEFRTLFIYLVISVQVINISATLPLSKAKEAKENKLAKMKDTENANNYDTDENTLNLGGRKLNIATVPKLGLPKKLAVENKISSQLNPSEPKTVRTSMGLRGLPANDVNKETTQKSISKAKERLQNAVAQRRTNMNSIAPPESLLRESKVVEMIDKKLSPIMNMLAQISKEVSKNSQTRNESKTKLPIGLPNQNSLTLRQFPPDSLERAETLHRGVKHIKNFMNILEQVDSYLSSKARSAIEQLSYIYEGDRGLKKPPKLTIKDKLHRLKGKLI